MTPIDELFGAVDSRNAGERQRNHTLRVFGSVADGLRAIANLSMTLQGAPSADPPERRRSLYERERDTAAQGGADGAKTYLAQARARTDTSMARLKAERENRLADARIAEIDARRKRGDADAQRRDKLVAKQLEEADSRIEARKRTAAACLTSATRGKGGSKGSTVRWIDPTTGERHVIDRGTWDKSSHTLFDIVVDTTRPEPDARGYPNSDEWRRHCRDTYGKRADSRDAFIIRNLPGNKRALDYLRRMK